jgi:L-alanine-DL-glutamate epimerase-like enolase superfamily enzyme
MRSVKVYEEAWPLHSPFVISRGSRSEACVVVVEIEEDGVKGVGECTPYPRYGESLASVMAQIMALVPELQKGLTRLALPQHLAAGLRVTQLIVRSGTWRPLNSTALYHRFWISRCRHRLSPRKQW